MTDATLTARLRPWASRRLVCHPDHGDEITFVLDRLKVVLSASALGARRWNHGPAIVRADHGVGAYTVGEDLTPKFMFSARTGEACTRRR